MDQLAVATKADSELQQVISGMSMGKLYQNPDLVVFQKIASELSVTESGVLLRGRRIVVPASLRKKMVEIAHEGHQGLIKTKALLRAKMWFPGLDSMVADIVSKCSSCAVVTKDEWLQPFQMSPLPKGPWQRRSHVCLRAMWLPWLGTQVQGLRPCLPSIRTSSWSSVFLRGLYIYDRVFVVGYLIARRNDWACRTLSTWTV